MFLNDLSGSYQFTNFMVLKKFGILNSFPLYCLFISFSHILTVYVYVK